jgi:hypothetical protein
VGVQLFGNAHSMCNPDKLAKRLDHCLLQVAINALEKSADELSCQRIGSSLQQPTRIDRASRRLSAVNILATVESFSLSLFFLSR